MLFSSDSMSLKQMIHRCSPVGWALLLVAALATGEAHALNYTYENTTSGPIPELGTDAACDGASALERTFTVNDSFTVATIALGFNATHAIRGHIRAILFAPGGSAVFIAQSADTDDNYDILLSTNSEGALDDNDTDPTGQPYFNRIVSLAGANFFTGNSAGTWTLRVCDRTGGTTGTFNRAYLMLGSATAATPVCTGSKPTVDWGTNGNVAALTTLSTTTNLTITQGATSDFAGTGASASGTLLNAIVTRTTTNGNHTGYYSLSMDATALGGTQDAENVGLVSNLTLSPAFQDLSFSFLDVDIAATPGAWEDQVEIVATDPAGARVPYTMTPVAGASAQLAGDLAEGDSSAATNQTTGNLNVVFSGAVSSLRINYTQGDDPASENVFMVVGISDFSMCGYDFGDAPLTYGAAGQAMGSRNLYLGATRPDGEAVTPAAPDPAASTDDNTVASGSIDDEDGVSAFPSTTITAGGSYTVTGIVVNNATGFAARLCGWIDFDTNGQGGATGDGAFGADEGACIAIPFSGGNANCTASGTTFTCSMTWTVPLDYVRNSASSTYARFRLSSNTGMTTSAFNDGGGAPSTSVGEVEDYQISSATLPVTVAWVESTRSGSDIALRFATATETANGGFRIWGSSAQGKRMLLGSIASQKTDSFEPLVYETTLRGTGLAAITAIEIEDLSLFDKNRLHGPFAVGSSFGSEPQADSIDWAAVRAESGVVTDLDRMRAAEAAISGDQAEVLTLRSTNAPASSGLLLVRQEGIHRVTYEQLLGAGIDLSGVPSARIALLDNGAGQPRHVKAPGDLFGPGSYIEFVARPSLTLASPVDAYLLTVDPRKAIAAAASDPGRGFAAQTVAVDRHRPDQVYSFAAPNGDPWFDARVQAQNAPATLTRTFDLPNLANAPVRLKVSLWGYGDFAGLTPDHHVVLKFNGSEIAERAFDGITPWEPEIDVTGLATATGNTLELFVPGDTGYPFDNIAFEGFEATYSRATVARAGRFQGTAERLRAFSIGGFSGAEPVSVWKVAGSVMTRQLLQPQRGSVPAAGGPGQVYASEQSALYLPGIVAGLPAAKSSSTAEYLIVTHPAFANAVSDLVALEESRGFSTEVVTVDRIFAAYSDHASSAAALKSFLSASLAKGELRYVLLVGADTSDPYDHLGLGSVSFVPTDYREAGPIVRYAPTDESLVDRQNDGLGDVPIGRLPVRTVAELEATVDKLFAWEQSIGSGQPSALLAAGLSDGARAISLLNESYAASLAGWNTVQAQVDDSNAAAVRQQVLAAANAGAHLMSYVGHSSMDRWDFSPLFTWQDVATLTNAGLPSLYTAWSCWNSYYVEPNVESLSARLLRQPNAGAAGVIGASTLTTEESHRALGTLFFGRVNAGAATVGEAFHGAKQDLATQGGAADAIYGMTLLGDPAMSLPIFQ